jgi:DNA-binding transcriptional LysR family regulator
MPTVDLNLLTALDALLQQGTVTGAARQLNLTPPAVSRSLKRLRDVTGDPLLTRRGRQLVPTPMALSLRERAHRVLDDVHDILAPRTEITDAQIEHDLEATFAIQAISDTAEIFGPELVRVIRNRTTRVRVTLLDDGPAQGEALPGGRIDVYLGLPLISRDDDVFRERLLADRMVIVGSSTGLLAQLPEGATLTPEQVVSAPHITPSRHCDFQAALGRHLDEVGLRREFAVSTPSFTSAFTILLDSDFLCMAPERLTRPLLGHGLITRPLAAPIPPVVIEMAWHRRTHTDPAHRWLRDRIRESARSIHPGALVGTADRRPVDSA